MGEILCHSAYKISDLSKMLLPDLGQIRIGTSYKAVCFTYIFLNMLTGWTL